jgi:hydroxymethylpyrimidine/phosphomethylpyrimidine kinase
MAKGSDVEEAVQKAKTFMNHSIAAGAAYVIGHGHGPVHHFFKWWG